MEDFNKTLRPFTTEIGGRVVSVFVFIKFKDGKLSITGVEGPKSNGDAHGSCGQIDMHEWTPHTYAPGWDWIKVANLRAIWAEWHLNDMRPYSPEMKAAGWPEKAQTRMAGHEFTLTTESLNAKKAAEQVALDCLRAGVAFTPTPEQVLAATRAYSVILWQPEIMATPAAPEGYRPAQHTYGAQQGVLKRPEIKTLGWLRETEHSEGMLSRKLNPDDAYGYGGKWWREDVPEQVLQWLRDLPDADKACPGSWGR